MRTTKSPRYWKISRRIVQITFLAAFLILFTVSRRGIWNPALINLPMRFDPLTMLSHLIASQQFQAGALLSLITLILTITLGRVWCGWICPLGSVLDFLRTTKNKNRRPNFPPKLRQVKIILLVVILVTAILGYQAVIYFDPLTILYRSLSTSILPALDWLISLAEKWLYQVAIFQEPISAFDSWIRPIILPPAPLLYRGGTVIGLVLLGIILLNWIAPRFWCRYLCPLGGSTWSCQPLCHCETQG